jgi:multidrug efflux system membrane fusion protein
VQNGVTVATRAVQRGPKGLFAFVVKPDNSVEIRPVETGQEERGRTLVTKGLNAGEQVVLDGQLRLQPGSVVQGTEDTAAGANAGVDNTVEIAPAGAAATVR